MPRPFKPWYHHKKKAWVIEPGGRVHVLLEGPDDTTTEQKAREELKLWEGEQILLRRANPPVDGGDPTVAAIIDAFLVFDEQKTCERFFRDRKSTLQLFSEVHGQKKVTHCVPYHLTNAVCKFHATKASNWSG